MSIYIHTYHLVKDQMSQMASTCAGLFGEKYIYICIYGVYICISMVLSSSFVQLKDIIVFKLKMKRKNNKISSCKNCTTPVLLLLWCHGVIVSFRCSQFTSKLVGLLEEELSIISFVSFTTRESHFSENSRCIKTKFPVSSSDWPGSEQSGCLL